MAITQHGSYVVTPADNGTNSTTTITLTPPASMVTGDLVVVFMHQRGTATFSVGVTGGQTWNTLTRATQSTTNAAGGFWCRYNGSWPVNPRFDFSAGTNTSAGMLVFRPSSGTKLWANEIDNITGYAAPAGACTVTIPSVTPTNNSNVWIAFWMAQDDIGWGGYSGNGTIFGGNARNLAGQDSSHIWVADIQTTATATGNLSYNQAINGCDAGIMAIYDFYEYDPPATSLKDVIGYGVIPFAR